MTLPALANVFCSPQDVYEYAGVEAAQLRLDDQNQASGQSVAATATAAVGATSITIAALQYPMLRGTRLVFSDAAMDAPVEVTLDAVAIAGATTLTVTALATQVNAGAIAIDNGVNVWLGSLLLKACKYATDRIAMYCVTRYDTSALAQSWTVNQWATVIAARWLGVRLYRAAPAQIEADYVSAMEELKAISAGELDLPGIGTRTAGWPFMSNVVIDLGYAVRKVRVEPTISEPTPTQYAQAIDWMSIYLLEF